MFGTWNHVIILPFCTGSKKRRKQKDWISGRSILRSFQIVRISPLFYVLVRFVSFCMCLPLALLNINSQVWLTWSPCLRTTLVNMLTHLMMQWKLLCSVQTSSVSNFLRNVSVQNISIFFCCFLVGHQRRPFNNDENNFVGLPTAPLTVLTSLNIRHH
jgi:hypothetical protein